MPTDESPVGRDDEQPEVDSGTADGSGTGDGADAEPGDARETREARPDDETDVERYRGSPGIGVFDDDEPPPEPNEPA